VRYFRDALRSVRADRVRRTVVDLRGVTFIGSTGVTAMLDAHARAQADGLALTVVPGVESVQHVFELTGTARILSFIDSAD
jgi:anti-sigma B factor antagonist